MTGQEMLEALENLDPAYIEAAAAPQVKKTNPVKRCAAIAACLVLLVSVGFGTYAYAAEAREYNAAMSFFGEYDLPTNGLTRGDIKAVYRDITTKSFNCEKTAEVIENSLTPEQKLKYEESKGDSSDKAADLWEYKTHPPASEPLIAPVELNTIEDAQQLLTNNYWYWRAAGCTFEKPEDISAKYYFYSGLHYTQRPNPNQFTEDEKVHLTAVWGAKYGENAWAGATKMPVAEINKALAYLGLTIENIWIPEEWTYYRITDSYYFYSTDTFGLVGHKVTELVKLEDGIVKIYWEVGEDAIHHNTATGEYYFNGVQYVMTLQEKTDGSYLICSNVPVNKEAAKLNTTEDAQRLLSDYWYWRAAGCTFEKPEDIPAKYYFYLGLHYTQRPNPNQFTEDEKAYLAMAWDEKYGKDAWASAAKMPVAKINEALICLGVTIEDIKIPAEWVYYEKTDSYYFYRTDAFGLVGHKVTELVKLEDGIVKIYWEVGEDAIHHNTATGEYYFNGVQYVMTLQEKTDGSYLICSNVPVE